MRTVYANSSGTTSNNQSLEFLRCQRMGADFREALATAAHELKTPLAVMDGYLHLLLAEKLGSLTAQANRSADRDPGKTACDCPTFVQNLLTYASLKVERLEMQYQKGDINACVREIAELWSQRFHDKADRILFPARRKADAVSFRLVQSAARRLQSAGQRHEVHAALRHGLASRRTVFLGAPSRKRQAAGRPPPGALPTFPTAAASP